MHDQLINHWGSLVAGTPQAMPQYKQGPPAAGAGSPAVALSARKRLRPI